MKKIILIITVILLCCCGRKSDKNKLLDGVYIPKLTMKQAKYLLENGTSHWFDVASKISIKCRDFEAGNWFLKNVYDARQKNNQSVSGIGILWGEYLMRHGKLAK